MITHQIARYAEPEYVPPTTKRFKGQFGSDAHRKYIFERSYAHQPFQIGDKVRFDKQFYTIIDIYSHLSAGVLWDHLKPLYVEIYDADTEDCWIVHPGDLKKVVKA